MLTQEHEHNKRHSHHDERQDECLIVPTFKCHIDGEWQGLSASWCIAGKCDGGAELAECSGPCQNNARDERGSNNRQSDSDKRVPRTCS